MFDYPQFVSGSIHNHEFGPSQSPAQLLRFEHYELVTDEDGQPLELGRGAMGVTYKAFDINLNCS
jgi:hypothetical protein